MTTTRPQLEHPFVTYLEGLVAHKDRAALAALRRGLGKAPGEVAELYPYVYPWLPGDDRPGRERREQAYFLIASLFALHQGIWHREDGEAGATNLGASFDRFAPINDPKRAATERRFVSLLNSDPHDLTELGEHLRHAVSLLKDITIDWAELLADVQRWGWDSRNVQQRWARAFWHRDLASTGVPEDSEEETNAEIATDSD